LPLVLENGVKAKRDAIQIGIPDNAGDVQEEAMTPGGHIQRAMQTSLSAALSIQPIIGERVTDSIADLSGNVNGLHSAK
jgi:hypothetical protein